MLKHQAALVSLFAVIAAVSLSVARPAHAQSNASRLGLGLIIGSPTAITGKFWLDEIQAADAGLSYDFDNSITLYGDYQHHWVRAFGHRKERFLRELAPYVGVGGLFHSSKDPYRDKKNQRRDESVVNLIVRVPFGVEWLPPRLPMGVFVELVPGIFIAPDVSPAFMGGVGIRYYFD